MATQPTILDIYTVDGPNIDAAEASVLIYGRRGWYQIQWHGVKRPDTVAQSSEYATMPATMKALREQAAACGVTLKKF